MGHKKSQYTDGILLSLVAVPVDTGTGGNGGSTRTFEEGNDVQQGIDDHENDPYAIFMFGGAVCRLVFGLGPLSDLDNGQLPDGAGSERSCRTGPGV